MNVSNVSSNVFTFTGKWPDGSTQVIDLQPGVSLSVPSGNFAGIDYADSYSASYQVVNADSGLQVHQGFTAVTYLASGFYWAIPVVATWLCIWAAVKGLRLTPVTSE